MKIQYLILSLLLILQFKLLPEDLDLSLQFEGIRYIKDGSQVKPIVFAGDSFNLKVVTSSSKSSNSEPSKPDGLDNFSVESVSSRSNISVINSAVKAEKIRNYTLIPKKEGLFNIGPSKIEHLGKTYKSNTLSLSVLSQSDKSRYKVVNNSDSKSESVNSDYELYCRLVADKTEAFVGEQVRVNFFIFARGDQLELDGIKLPEFNNCSIESDEKFKEFHKSIDGKNFKVYEKEFLVYPSKQGKIDIEPGRVSYKVRSKTRSRSFGFFDDDFFPFRSFGAERKLSATNPVSVKIIDLPIKDNVDGIGIIRKFEARVDKTNVIVNEPIKLVLELEGDFNFENVIFNNPDLPDVFKSYESKVESDKKARSKRFEFVLQASNSGTLQIPSQAFNYFDTNEKKQKLISTRPIQILASMPSGQKNIAYHEQEKHEDELHIKKDSEINFIEEDGPIQCKRSFHLAFWFFLFFVLFAPIIFYSNKIKYYFSSFLGTRFYGKRDILSEYKNKITSLIDDEESTELYNLFINLFVEISGASLGTVNVEWIERFLMLKGFDKKQADDFASYLHDCAQLSFINKKRLTYETAKRLKNEGINWLTLILKTVKHG